MLKYWKTLFRAFMPIQLGVFDTGDIPSGAFGNINVVSFASVASNGANATYGGAGVVNKVRAPQDMKILSAWYEPHAASFPITQVASYRRLTLLDGGADASGTAVLGSLNLTASLAVDTQRAFTLAATPTVDQGDVIYVSQLTVGGTDDPDTELQAGTIRLAYKPI